MLMLKERCHIGQCRLERYECDKQDANEVSKVKRLQRYIK